MVIQEAMISYITYWPCAQPLASAAPWWAVHLSRGPLKVPHKASKWPITLYTSAWGCPAWSPPLKRLSCDEVPRTPCLGCFQRAGPNRRRVLLIALSLPFPHACSCRTSFRRWKQFTCLSNIRKVFNVYLAVSQCNLAAGNTEQISTMWHTSS